jgi:hypothetical protein
LDALTPEGPGPDLPPLTLGGVLRFVGGLALLVGLLAAVGQVVREPVHHVASAAVRELGLPGLFAAVLTMDPIPGLGFQPALFFGYAGGIQLHVIIGAAWSASLVASVVVFCIGRCFRGSTRLLALLDRWRVGGWLRAHGARTIAVAAIAPVPYGLATLGAGAVGVRLRDLLIGASFRGLKIAATAGAIALGWGMGA